MALSLALVGCTHQVDEGAIGRFQINASRSESCGDAGVLGSTAQRAFVVHLRRSSESTLQWNENGAITYLGLEGDGVTFLGESTRRVDMRAGAEGFPPCTIERHDELGGVLEGPAVGPVTGFKGSMRFGYTPVDGSSCDDLTVGPEAIAEALPCAIGYELVAERLE
jgi:hypothetical protein